MEDGYAVKAILAHDTLVHPDHPLRLPGRNGIELSIGEPVPRGCCLSPNGGSLIFQVF
jgi:hypothetical protein